MKNKRGLLASVWVLILAATVTQAATDWSTQDYDLHAGDFDGDGRSDLLYIAKDVARASGIVRSSGGAPDTAYQSWPSAYLGIPWHDNLYSIHVADFNGDGKSDLFLQRSTPGDSYLLFADGGGKITAISQTVSQSTLGLNWSADQHEIHAGDFNGDGRADFFLQAITPEGVHAVVLADSNGQITTGPEQSWTDSSWAAFKWSSRNSYVFVGDFNGDGREDLLLQARPNIVLFDKDLPVPVLTYPPNLNGVVLSQGGSAPFQQIGVEQWDRNAHGVDWSPGASNIIVGDFDGNGTSDVMLQTRSGRASYWLPGSVAGAAFTVANALATNVTWSADSYRLIAGNFDGTGGAGIYFQAVSRSGTNYYANAVTGSSVTVTAHDPSSATGVVAATAVGRTVGSFAVSDGGAATYSIPITVPGGVAGLQPSLAIQYTSGAGGGALGVGWDLGGFSEISRCDKTLVQDNSNDTVQLSTADRFCLDGAKLRLTGGVYGATGSTYQTELETFAVITAFGNAGNGPAYFTVEAKDGLIYEYGNTADSRIESLNPAASTTPRVWALNKVSDRHGSYMKLTYEEDGAPNGSYRPKSVSYTANDAAALSAAYRVDFHWEPRPAAEKMSAYIAGGLVQEAFRLARLETWYDDPSAGWRLVRKYRSTYNTSGVSGRSRLGAIQECDGTGACLAPTTIAWQEGTLGWPATPLVSASVPSTATTSMPLDLNGDGRTDYFFYDTSNKYWRVMFANSDGTHQSPVNVYSGSKNFQTAALPMDVNGDGKLDLLVATESSEKWTWVRHTGASSFVAVTTALSAFTTGTVGTFGMDVDGDGLDDVVSASQTSISVAFNQYNPVNPWTPNFTVPTTAWDAAEYSSVWIDTFGIDLDRSDLRTADFDGDSRDDLLLLTRENICGSEPSCPPRYRYTWTILRSTGAGFVTGATVYSALDAAPSRPMLTDLNADGITDLIYTAPISPGSSTSTWRYTLSTGTGSVAFNTNVLAESAGAASDCDADGYPDLVAATASQSHFCLRSDGAGLTSVGISLSSVGAPSVTDVNGDGLRDFIEVGADSKLRVRLHRGVLPDFVSAIADGFGNTVNVTYAPLTDSSVYAPGSGAVYPELDIQGPLYVVKQYRVSDGLGGSYTVSESYGQARVHARGRGFLGFATRTTTDGRTGISSTTSYRQDFPYIGFAGTATTYQPGGSTVISQAINTLQSLTTSSTQYSERVLPYVSQAVQKNYEVGGTANGQQIAEVTTTTTLDSYGNPTNVTTTTVDKAGSNATYTTAAVSTYDTADATCWRRGFVTQQTITNTVPGHSAQTRTTQFVRDTGNAAACRVEKQIVEPNISALKVTSTFEYDLFGHPKKETVSAANITDRVTEIDYGSRGVFPVLVKQQVTSSFWHTSSKAYDFALGVPLTATDVNGLVASFEYDGFGRMTKEKRPDGTKTTWQYSTCTVANGYCGDSKLRYKVQKDELDASNPGSVIRTSLQFFDSLSRSLYEQVQTLSGAFSTVATIYDNQGRVSQRSRPYFSGFPAYFTTVTYDLIGRVIKEERRVNETDATLQTTQYAYARLLHTQTDPNNKVTKKEFNVLGQVVKMTDAANGVTTYEYDQFGNLTKTADPTGNQIVSAFNIRGFKESTSDPDMGSWAYTYYPTGELWTQRDAKNQTATFAYDRLARPETRIEPEGTTTFTYGTSAAGKNVGKLTDVSSPGGYSEAYVYDSLGRIQQMTTVADATSYLVDNSYHSLTGLLETVTYPTSTTAVPGSRFKVQYEYAHGLMKQVRDFNLPSTVYWEPVATNAAGQVIDEQYGNGLHTYSTYDSITGLLGDRTTGSSAQIQNIAYTWDKVGNLTQRKDNGLSFTEDFTYDDLYRVTTSKLNNVTNLSLTYTANGNIQSKSDVGTYSYPAQGGSQPRPHAVLTAGSQSFSYDPNGNMTTRNGSSITWYSYNLPNRIDKGSNYAQFYYGADRSRYKQVSVTAAGGPLPAGTETTIYIGGLYERVTKPSGVVEHKHYVLAGKEAIAIRTLRSNSVNDTRYLHKDHLGSVDVITNESGAVVQRLSYDAFGQRRSAAIWSGAPSSGDWANIAAITHRGFTFHEQLDNVDLIHMNGRVYDPLIARFISADPLIQAPLNSQSLNRYSYVMNNPLSFTDPSGFFFKKLFKGLKRFVKKYWREIVAIAVTVVSMGTMGPMVGFWGAVAKGAAAGAIYGATVTALYGGNLRQVLGAALMGGIAGGVAAGIGYAMFAKPAQPRMPIDFGWESISPSTTEGPLVQLSRTGVDPSVLRGMSSAADVIKIEHDPDDVDNKVVTNGGLLEHKAISIVTKGTHTTMTVDLRYGAYGASEFAVYLKNDLARFANRTFQKGDQSITLQINLIAGDGTALPYYRLKSCSFMECGSYAAIADRGGNRIRFRDPRAGTGTHEVLHTLGLGHQLNSTGSIMSYAGQRDVLFEDVKRLVDHYGPLLGK